MTIGRKQRHYPIGNFAPDFDEPEVKRPIDFNLGLPNGGGGGGGNTAARFIPGTLTKAGLLPTAEEIKSSIEDAYSSASVDPQVGDVVYMTEFHYLIGEENDITGNPVTENDIFVVIFTVNDVSFAAFQIGPTRYL